MTVSEGNCVFTHPTVEFDGHTFISDMMNPAAIPCIRLAYDARRGDGVSARLLDAFRVTILTDKGDKYWPMEDAPIVVDAR